MAVFTKYSADGETGNAHSRLSWSVTAIEMVLIAFRASLLNLCMSGGE
jgi:hypothetical protein